MDKKPAHPIHLGYRTVVRVQIISENNVFMPMDEEKRLAGKWNLSNLLL